MKMIQYGIAGTTAVYDPETETVAQQEVICTVTLPWSAENEERAKREAYNGAYEIIDDGQPEPVREPTTDEILNALLGVE